MACVGKVEIGIEISGIDAVDIYNHKAFHLQIFQTLNQMDNDYPMLISNRKYELSKFLEYVVADAFFCKSFVDSMFENEFHLVYRLRNDANLRYLYTEEQESEIGRPKQYNEKLNTNWIVYKKTDLKQLSKMKSK
ncbi:MAG: hypothetical protein N4A49_10785 [Marinifilaceae bacterium]|nr:hypothetical protein [Marinifilaceae bacterium]